MHQLYRFHYHTHSKRVPNFPETVIAEQSYALDAIQYLRQAIYELHRFQRAIKPALDRHSKTSTQAYNILIVHVQIRDIIFGYCLIELYLRIHSCWS